MQREHPGDHKEHGMSLGNLTRTEAQHRAEILHVDAYHIELDLTGGEEAFGSRSTVRFECFEFGASTFLDLLATEVSAVTLNGRELDPAEVYRDGRVHLDGLAATNTVTVVATCPYTHDAEGMHRSVDPADGEVYLFTQFESDHARQVYACFEQPDLKAAWQLDVIAPARWEVVSNMPTPIPADVAAEVKRWSFEPTPLLPTYLTVIVAGPFHMVRDGHRMTLPDGSEVVIPLGLGCRQSLARYLDADEFLQITKDGLDFFVKRFGHPYPFAKYDQMLIPEYGGAMEHPGAVTFADGSFVFRSAVTEFEREMRAFVILHEMAHMWFGDLVTMRWWDDLWLNESFATYVGAVAVAESSRFSTVWATFTGMFKTRAAAADQMPTTHPIVGDVPDLDSVQASFDRITYDKGASVLQQLVAWVGPERFAAGVNDYFTTHAWSNATASDFLGALATASGRDLDEWAAQWLRTAGVNTLRAEFTLDSGGTFTSFAVLQEADPERPTLRSHRIAIGSYDTHAGALARTGQVALDVVGARTEVPSLIGHRQPELLLLNDDDQTYAKIRLDDVSLATAVAGVGSITDPLARALVWSAAWDMCRDGQMAARDYVAMVLAGIDRETLPSTVRSLLGQCTTAIFRYADPNWIDTGTAAMAMHAGKRLGELPAGSDAQLIWVGALAEFARSEDDLDFVAGLLDGSESIAGLAIETGLRWQLVIALATAGRLDGDAIAVELANDDTVSGAHNAAIARAAIPTAAAKAAAWETFVANTEPAPIQMATAQGFAQVGQDALRAPYAEAFFASAPDFFERSDRLGRALITTLYPADEVSVESLERADIALDQVDLAPSLRRMLIESRDAVARALRARAKDSSME
jgi:aminopeptidase N